MELGTWALGGHNHEHKTNTKRERPPSVSLSGLHESVFDDSGYRLGNGPARDERATLPDRFGRLIRK